MIGVAQDIEGNVDSLGLGIMAKIWYFLMIAFYA
jgi:hypothetical protein